MERIKAYFTSLGINLNDQDYSISKIINEISLKNEVQQESIKLQLRSMALALYDIKDYNKSVYKKYVKRIVTSKNESIYGHIFEIMQCAHFIQVSKINNLNFKFGEPNKDEPDLICNGFGFEVTSSRFSDDSLNFDPSNKLFHAFRKKNKKQYVNNKTVLLIDVTNISQRAYGKSVSMSLKDFSLIIKQESKFGAVVFLTEWIDTETLNVSLIASEFIFADNCDSDLKKMIESLFFNDNTTSSNMFLSDIK